MITQPSLFRSTSRVQTFTFFIVHSQFPVLDFCTINHDAWFRSGLVMTKVMKMDKECCAVEGMERMKRLDLESASGPGYSSDPDFDGGILAISRVQPLSYFASRI